MSGDIDTIHDDELADEALDRAYAFQGRGINTLGTAGTVTATLGTAGCNKP
jgi:hypothetical protein